MSDHTPPADEVIVANGQLLGRFSLVSYHQAAEATLTGRPIFDWLPDPDGTHDAYVLGTTAYLVEVGS